MREPAAVALVVVVLLSVMTVPAVGLQGGPPDHAEGDGPPEHAEGNGDGPPAENGPSNAAGDEAGDATHGEDERAGGEEEEVPNDGGGDGGGDDPTATDEPTATDDGGVSPTETVRSLLPFGDEDDSTPEESEEAETRTAEDDDPTIPPIVDGDDDPTPTPTPEGADEYETATPSDDGDDSSPSRDGDDSSWSTSSSDGSDDSAGSDADDPPSVEIRINDTATVVEVTGVEAGDTVEADLRGPATDGEGVSIESIAIDVGEEGSFTTAVTRPAAESDVETAPGVPVAYFEVGSVAAVAQATLTLDVDENSLPEGVEPADLEVLRYQDGEWESVETADDEGPGVHTVETSGSGTFAVAASVDGPIEVANVQVVDRGNGSGGERTVRATAENTGDRESTRTVAATVDGETVATREVTLEPGEAATLAFDLRNESGTVAVGGVEAEQQRAQGTDPGGAPAPAPASTGGNPAFGVGAAVLVVLSAAGTGLLAARHEDWDWEP